LQPANMPQIKTTISNFVSFMMRSACFSHLSC
jgi:hypothetical protein